MTTAGMCSFCRFNAAVPNGDLCRDCIDLRADVRRRRMEVTQQKVCRHGHPAGACRDCDIETWDGGGEAA